MAYYEVYKKVAGDTIRLGVIEAISSDEALNYASIRYNVGKDQLVVYYIRALGCCE